MIEARFEIAGYGMRPFFEENELEYEDECILRREVYASGKVVHLLMIRPLRWCR